MWILGCLVVAVAVLSWLRYRRLERRWRWRWQELPSGVVHAGPALGVYREAGVTVPRRKAPACVRAAAAFALLHALVPLLLGMLQLAIYRRCESQSYDGVFAVELLAWGASATLIGGAAARLLARRPTVLTGWLLLSLGLVAAFAVGVCGTQFMLGARFYFVFDPFAHADAVVWELTVANFLSPALPLLVLRAASRRFEKDLSAPTRFLEWGNGLIDTQPAS